MFIETELILALDTETETILSESESMSGVKDGDFENEEEADPH